MVDLTLSVKKTSLKKEDINQEGVSMGHHKGSPRRKEEEEYKVGRKVIVEAKAIEVESPPHVSSRQAFQTRLTHLKQATSGAWVELRGSVGTAASELRTGVQKAVSVFQSSMQVRNQ